jgi:hypothetical protein
MEKLPLANSSLDVSSLQSAVINESSSSSPCSIPISSSLLSTPSINLKSPASPVHQITQQIDNISSDSFPSGLTGLSFVPCNNSNVSSNPPFVLQNSSSSSGSPQSVQFSQSQNLSHKILHSDEVVSPEMMLMNLSSSPVDRHTISGPAAYSVEEYSLKEEPSLGIVKGNVDGSSNSKIKVLLLLLLLFFFLEVCI